MKLVPPTLNQCQQVRLWRNESMESLRTPYELSESMQENFFLDVICDRSSPHRYWSIIDTWNIDNEEHICCVGFGGLTFIEWENRIARISLILDPAIRGKGLGEKAVDLILDKAFNYMNLKTVCGECYKCNPAWEFWLKIVKKYNGASHVLPCRKFWNGTYHDSLFFAMSQENYAK